jgi:hypothetical protein
LPGRHDRPPRSFSELAGENPTNLRTITENQQECSRFCSRRACPSLISQKALVDRGKASAQTSALAKKSRGGLRGGKARAESLTADRRKKITKKAARARWKRRKKDQMENVTSPAIPL